jgi:hypothetical protein
MKVICSKIDEVLTAVSIRLGSAMTLFDHVVNYC